MHEVIPSILLPYLGNSLEPASLTLVTSTLTTPTNWLLVRFINAVLQGVDGAARSTPNSAANPVNLKASTIFVSVVRPLDLWNELCKKVGLDLPSSLAVGRVHYIDGLATKQSPGTFQASGHATSLKALSLDAVCSAINAATTLLSSQTDVPPTKPTIIIDGLDFILAFQPNADVVKIQDFISQLRQSANALVLTCSADSPLLHNSHDSATPLERNHAAFLASMAHQSNWIMQLRGLNTGTAKDVTGVLRISKGGADEEEEIAKTGLVDVECLYQVKGDGSVRMWLRGE